MAINVKDIDKIAAEIKAAEKSDLYEHILNKYTGPDTGLIWDEDAGMLKIASTWHVDANGDVVRI